MMERTGAKIKFSADPGVCLYEVGHISDLIGSQRYVYGSHTNRLSTRVSFLAKNLNRIHRMLNVENKIVVELPDGIQVSCRGILTACGPCGVDPEEDYSEMEIEIIALKFNGIACSEAISFDGAGDYVGIESEERESTRCRECKGTGKYIGLFKEEDCSSCGGTGRTEL